MAWHAPGRPVWPMRDPAAFAREGYGRNAIAYRCVRLIAEAAASAPLQVGPSGHGGVLASVTNEDVLNGANAFAIEADDEWEIVQAAECELVEPGVYELRTFLRGLQGSAHAMRAPHPVGARIVKLDQRLARVSVNAHEWQELLNFIAPPAAPRHRAIALRTWKWFSRMPPSAHGRRRICGVCARPLEM